MRSLIRVALFTSVVLQSASALWADGGAVCLSELKGNYRITVFSGPTPVRAGLVDISVLVQDARTQQPVAGVEVTIAAKRRGASSVEVQRRATTEAATNKLYLAAEFDLPDPGVYEMDVSITEPGGHATVRFEMEAADPLPAWRSVWPWVGWPILVILLFGVHQILVGRRSHGRPTSPP